MVAKRFTDRARGVPTMLGILIKSSKLLTIFKSLKFASVFITATSMLISMFVYDLLAGPVFAITLIVVLFVHEMGHVVAMVKRGMRMRLLVFIPALGAFIAVPEINNDRQIEAYVGIGGPVAGGVLAILCFAAYLATGSIILANAAFLGFYLNLFNMIPLKPLDGGRVMQIVGEQFNYLWFILLAGVTLLSRQPSLIMIWIIMLMEIRSIPRWWRSAAGIFLTVLMAVLYWLGYEPLPFWLQALDVGIAMLLTTMFVANDLFWYHPITQLMMQPDRRAYPAKRVRIVWLCRYVVLTGVLLVGMGYLIAHIQAQHTDTGHGHPTAAASSL